MSIFRKKNCFVILLFISIINCGPRFANRANIKHEFSFVSEKYEMKELKYDVEYFNKPTIPKFIISADKNLFITKATYNGLYVLDIKKNKILFLSVTNNEELRSIAYNEEDGLIYLVGDEKYWYVMTVKEHQTINKFVRLSKKESTLSFNDSLYRNGKYLILEEDTGNRTESIMKSKIHTIKIRDVKTKNHIFDSYEYYKQRKMPFQFSWMVFKTIILDSADNYLFYVFVDEVAIIDIKKAEIIHRLTDWYSIDSLNISNDGSLLATGTSGFYIQGATIPIPGCIYLPFDYARIWNINTGEKIYTLNNHRWGVLSVDFSTDNKFFVSTSALNINIWDLSNGKLIRTIVDNTIEFTKALFSPSCKEIIASCTDGAVRIWDIGTGKQIAALSLFVDGGWVVVSHDGRYDGDEKGFKHVYWEAGNKKIYINQYKPENQTKGLVKEILYK